MDGSVLSPTVLVEMTGDVPLILEKPMTGERRAARKGDKLYGMETRLDDVTWVLFEDGYAVRMTRLKAAWDDLQADVSVWDGTTKTGDFF